MKFLIAIAFVTFCISCQNSGTGKTSESQDSAAGSETVEQKWLRKAKHDRDSLSRWHYLANFNDDSVFDQAEVAQTELLGFETPSQGQFGILWVVRPATPRAPKIRSYVMVRHGMFASTISGGLPLQNVSVKFDDGPEVKYEVNVSNDELAGTFDFPSSSDFVQRMLKSQKVSIDAEFYKKGHKPMTFPVGGLHWPGKWPLKLREPQ